MWYVNVRITYNCTVSRQIRGGSGQRHYLLSFRVEFLAFSEWKRFRYASIGFTMSFCLHQHVTKWALKAYPCTGFERPCFQEVEVNRIFRQLAHECGRVVGSLHPQGKCLVLISVRGRVEPRTKKIKSMKNPKDPIGIETATFGL